MTISIAPNNPALIFSPYNWKVDSSQAMTINAGAYFRTLFSGNSCILHFDISGNISPLSQVAYRLDSGPWRRSALAADIPCIMETATAGWNFHVLEVVVMATSETLNRWTTQQTKVVLEAIEIDNGATVRRPTRRSMNVLMYTDSRGEGVRTIALNGANSDVDRNDAMNNYAFQAGIMLGAEFGIIGFGSTGLTQGGNGLVPPLTESYDKLWEGQTRFFDPPPDHIILDIATNDGALNTRAAGLAVVNGLLASNPLAHIWLVRPFNGAFQAANLQYVAANCSDPTRVHYVDTEGWWQAVDASDGIHQYGFTAQIIAALLVGYIQSQSISGGGRFRQVSMFA